MFLWKILKLRLLFSFFCWWVNIVISYLFKQLVFLWEKACIIIWCSVHSLPTQRYYALDSVHFFFFILFQNRFLSKIFYISQNHIVFKLFQIRSFSILIRTDIPAFWRILPFFSNHEFFLYLIFIFIFVFEIPINWSYLLFLTMFFICI